MVDQGTEMQLQRSRLCIMHIWRWFSFFLHWCQALALIICLAHPIECNEWNQRLVTAFPLPLVPHVRQWLYYMLQIPPPPSSSSSSSRSTHQPISDRTLSPLTVPGIHPLRATCHRHSLPPCYPVRSLISPASKGKYEWSEGKQTVY